MGQDTIGDVTATDISTHLEQMDQLTQQNAELFDRIQEIFTQSKNGEIES
jgi:hypothetical protein